MKKLLLLCGLAVLAGCAGQGQGGIGLSILETQPYMRDERWVPRTFVQVQKAVLQQQTKCGSNIQFAVDEDHPSYARVTQKLDSLPGQDDGGWSRTLVLGLQMMTSLRLRGNLYSYYEIDKTQIQAMYNAILHPDICPGQPIPPEPPKPAENEEE